MKNTQPVHDASTMPGAELCCSGSRALEPDHAPSLIETMRVEPGRSLPLLRGHLARLERSAHALGYAWPGPHAITSAIMEHVGPLDAAQLWRLRLLLAPDATLTLEVSPLERVSGPLGVALAGPRSSGAETYLGHKTTHRPWYREATAWLSAHPETFDVLFWNQDDEMCEGSRTNLYMQTSDGRWLTPPQESGALPGVQRQALLDAGLVEVARIPRDVFLQARAWRVSNALRGWCDTVNPADVRATASALPHRRPPTP